MNSSNHCDSKPRLTAIQLCSTPDVIDNLHTIEQQLKLVTQRYPNNSEHLVVLPEACLFFGGKDVKQHDIAEPLNNGMMQRSLQQLAEQYGVYLLAGSVPITFIGDNKFSATSLLFAPTKSASLDVKTTGDCLAYYQKIHLFDVDVQDNEKVYRESAITQAGRRVATQVLDSMKLGFSICYDLRFPELFRNLTKQGCGVIAVPSAFTQVTGEAHWESLLRARAIENQVYIVAAGQQGTHQNGRQTYGHSMIISPWGDILAIKEQGTGFISAEYDAQLIAQIRSDIPVSIHNQFSVSLN